MLTYLLSMRVGGIHVTPNVKERVLQSSTTHMFEICTSIIDFKSPTGQWNKIQLYGVYLLKHMYLTLYIEVGNNHCWLICVDLSCLQELLQFNAVNFLPNLSNRYPTARPHRRATIKCFLSTRSDLHPTSVTAVIYVTHHVILDRVITAPDCILRLHRVTVIDLSHNSHNASDTSHNAPFCNRNVHISVTKWCIAGYV